MNLQYSWDLAGLKHKDSVIFHPSKNDPSTKKDVVLLIEPVSPVRLGDTLGIVLVDAVLLGLLIHREIPAQCTAPLGE